MILERAYVAQATVLMPGNFATSTDFRKLVDSYHGHEFYTISALDYSVACTVELKTNILHVKATPRGKNLQTFDNKITTGRCAKLPPNCVFHFNYDGLVMGVTKNGNIPLPLDETITAIISANLVSVPKVRYKTAESFIAGLIRQIQWAGAVPWSNLERVGFYIGTSELKHTNSMALSGIVSSILPKAAKVRIKGIWKHVPAYAEMVFWLELKQASNEVYTELSESKEELSIEFMRKLVICL